MTKEKFGPYKDFESCVNENRGKVGNPEGFCSAIHHKITGQWPSEEIVMDNYGTRETVIRENSFGGEQYLNQLDDDFKLVKEDELIKDVEDGEETDTLLKTELEDQELNKTPEVKAEEEKPFKQIGDNILPDGTGPHGRGLGPGEGKGDGTGLQTVDPIDDTKVFKEPKDFLKMNDGELDAWIIKKQTQVSEAEAEGDMESKKLLERGLDKAMEIQNVRNGINPEEDESVVVKESEPSFDMNKCVSKMKGKVGDPQAFCTWASDNKLEKYGRKERISEDTMFEEIVDFGSKVSYVGVEKFTEDLRFVGKKDDGRLKVKSREQ